MINFREVLQRAQDEKYAIGSFNFSTLEQLQGIVEAAKEKQSPVILATSSREAAFIGMRLARALVNFFKERSWPFLFLNLDHGKDLVKIKKAIDLGYDMVHFDGSTLSLEENIERTKEVLSYAHKKGVLVEGELGFLRGGSFFHEEAPVIEQKDFTNPQEAGVFSRETQIDLLAIAVGNIHGVFQGANPRLDLERIGKIREESKKFLVLHGGSGISQEMIRGAIDKGIVKININTELRLAYTQSLKELLTSQSQEIRPYKYLPQVIEEVKKVVLEKIDLFGSAGKMA